MSTTPFSDILRLANHFLCVRLTRHNMPRKRANMTESEFNEKVEDTLEAIEALLDNEAETDLDYDTVGGVLTIICENRSQIIFTRQAPVSQLWVATVDGGYHFDFSDDLNTWVLDSDQTPLSTFLSATFAKQAGEDLTFSL